MPRLFLVTVPGLEVKSDWLPVHDRLLDEFPAISDVLATTIPETVLIVYQGRADVDAWLEGMDEALAFRRLKPRAQRDARAPDVRSVGVPALPDQSPVALYPNKERTPA